MLKQSYFSQMDSGKCWTAIDEIIQILDYGFRYLATDDVKATGLELLNKEKIMQLYDDVTIEGEEFSFMKDIIQKTIQENEALRKQQSRRGSLRKQSTSKVLLPKIDETTEQD